VFFTVTVAPLIGAPEASSTLPEIAADTWAIVAFGQPSIARTKNNRNFNFEGIFSL
jgi:hypothetical protein